jgi:hypothetical protein
VKKSDDTEDADAADAAITAAAVTADAQQAMPMLSLSHSCPAAAALMITGRTSSQTQDVLSIDHTTHHMISPHRPYLEYHKF